MINFLLDIFDLYPDNDALIWQDKSYTYKWISDRIGYWRGELKKQLIATGEIVVLEADFSPNSISLFLALVEARCILVPMTSSVRNKREEFIEAAQAERIIMIDDEDSVSFEKCNTTANHELYLSLRERQHPGLVLFSSGSTGKSKCALHNMVGILEKFKTRKKQLSAITFLLYDHIGGVNTMLYILSNAGCIVTVSDRIP